MCDASKVQFAVNCAAHVRALQRLLTLRSCSNNDLSVRVIYLLKSLQSVYFCKSNHCANLIADLIALAHLYVEHSKLALRNFRAALNGQLGTTHLDDGSNVRAFDTKDGTGLFIGELHCKVARHTDQGIVRQKAE
jgi:hypothetical protein